MSPGDIALSLNHAFGSKQKIPAVWGLQSPDDNLNCATGWLNMIRTACVALRMLMRLAFLRHFGNITT